MEQMIAHGARNDDATWVYVKPCCEIDMYQHNHFTGWRETKVYKQSGHGFAINHNDQVSSIKVRSVACPSAGSNNFGGW